MALAGQIIDVIKRHFISGMLVVVPIILTYIVLKFLFEAIDGILQPIIYRAFGYFVPGLGVITTLLLIILAGFFTRNFIGAWLYRRGDKLLARMPIIRPIYMAAKQLLESMTVSSAKAFKQIGLVEYPRKGTFALCFIAKPVELYINTDKTKYVSVFISS